MKFFSFHIGVLALLLGIAVGLELEKRDCAADNCLRQVQATRPAAQSHMASLDCSSYLAGSTTTVTYTPGLGQTITASTTTKTVHITSTSFVSTFTSEIVDLSVVFTASVSTVIIPGKKRDVAKAVPTYASSCTAVGQYASACSCYGVFPPHTTTKTVASVAPVTITKTFTTTISTEILATKTAIETSTLTRIHTFAYTETIAASSFSLYVVGAGTPVDGWYAYTLQDTDTLLEVNFAYNSPFVIPQFFTLDQKTGNLYQDSYVAVASVDDYNGLTFQSGISKSDPTRLVCSVAAGGILNCAQQSEDLSVFYVCLDESGEEFPPALYFYPPNSESIVPFGCYAVQFKQMLAT